MQGFCFAAISAYLFVILPTNILSYINEDIGPSPYIAWFNIARTLSLSFTYTILGRLSDLFGRRWFFIGGNITALIGIIICATAQNVNSLIVGAAVFGLGETVQLSFNVALGELVPNKYRPMVLSFIFLTNAPFASFGGMIGTSTHMETVVANLDVTLTFFSSPEIHYQPFSRLAMVLLHQYHCRQSRDHPPLLLLPPSHIRSPARTQDKAPDSQGPRLPRYLPLDRRAHCLSHGCLLGWQYVPLEVRRDHLSNSDRHHPDRPVVPLGRPLQPKVPCHSHPILL